MDKRFRPGQWPSAPRLWDIDLEVILDDVRQLFAYAREGGCEPFDPHRARVALSVATSAARARERLAKNEAVPPHELASLVGLHRSRLYQMVRSRQLVLGRGGVTAESARQLFAMPHVSAPPVAHRLWVAPSYTQSDWIRWGMTELYIREIVAPLQLPRGITYVFSSRGVELRVPATAKLTAQAAEALRRTVLARLEEADVRRFIGRSADEEVARA